MDKIKRSGLSGMATLLLAVEFGLAQTPVLPPRPFPMARTASVNPSQPGAMPAASASPKPPAYKLYSYEGDRYRDPFIPLTGENHTDQTSDRPPAVSSLSLKGLFRDSRGRIALLVSGVSSYFLRGGQLY